MPDWLRRHRGVLAVFAAAAAWFLPGLWWGLPVAGSVVPLAWGPDELAPWGVRSFLDALRHQPSGLSAQYPLAQYFVQAALSWPWQLVLSAADNVGLPPQAASLAGLTLLGRLPSLLMAAGTVVAVWVVARRISDSRSGALVAAAATATIGPLAYYARTSNVDGPALFWVALALIPAVTALRDGLTVRRALACGLCAGLGTATKDQQYAVFAGLGVALLAAHIARARSAGERTPWRAPLVGLLVAGASWAIASGLVLLPTWFGSHLRFITEGGQAVPEEYRQSAGFYFSNPATVAGYLSLARESAAQLLAALGLPFIGLAIAGMAHAARRDRRLLLLLLVPCLTLVGGVLVPVRFVLPRFLLPIELVLCLFAGLAVAAARRPGWQRAVATVAALGMAWSALRGVDLTRQMVLDARYEAGAWLSRNVIAGDTIGYYGARLKLPAIPGVAVLSPAPDRLNLGEERAASPDPAFIITVPQQLHEIHHEWVLPDSAFARLLDGSRGYVLVLAIQRRGLFTRPRRVAPHVNPPVRIFMRRDLLPRLRDPARLELPSP